MTDTSNGLSSEQIEELKRRKAERDKRSAAFNDQRNAALETDAPDDAAYDLKKSQELGIPREAIGGARDEYKNDDMLAAMEKMRSQAPRTSEWMRTPENYAVARDDMETFSKIEKDLDPWLTPGGGRLMAIGKSASEFGKAVGRFGKAGLMSAGSSLVDVDREQLEKASRYYDDYDAWSAREAERKSRGEGGVMNRLGWSSINLPKLTPTGNTMFSMPKLDGTFKLPVPGDTDPMPQVPAAISDVYMSERFRQQKEAGGFAAPLAKDQYLYGREMALAVRPLIAEKVDEAIDRKSVV